MSKLDLRIGKKYSGADDVDFIRDTIYVSLADENRNEALAIARDLQLAMDTRVKTTLALAEVVAKAWKGSLDQNQSPLLFKQAYAIARVLNCNISARSKKSPGEEQTPELDLATLCYQIRAALAKEFAIVEASTARATANPSALTHTLSGNAAALQAYLDKLPLKSVIEQGTDTNSTSQNSIKRSFMSRFRRNSGRNQSPDAVAAQPSVCLEDALLETDSSHRTALHLAARFNYINCVKVLLAAAKRAGPETFRQLVASGCDGDGTPLYTALRRYNKDCIMAFLEAGVDFYAGASTDEYHLRNRSAIEILVKQASLEPLDYLPILKAVLIELSKRPGFDINAELKKLPVDDDLGSGSGAEEAERGETAQPIGSSSENGDRVDFGEVDAEEQDQNEAHSTDNEEEEEAVNDELGADDAFMFGFRDFLRRGMLGDSMGTGLKRTLLSTAAEHGGIDAMHLLLEAGARPEGPILHPVVRYIHASRDPMLDMIEEIEDEESDDKSVNVVAGLACLKALLDNGANVNAAETHSQRTALHTAAGRGCTAAARLLLDAGADINVRDKSDQTPLELAEENGHTEVVELLTRQKRLRRLLSPNLSSSRRRAQEEADADLPDAEKCVICLQNKKEVIAAPCGHRSMCRRCMRALLTRPEAERNCPVCRDKLESYVLCVYDV